MGRSSSEIDWEKIEAEYRIGSSTVREIAKQNGVAPSAITRRSTKYGWTRDLSKAVDAGTKAVLIERAKQQAIQQATADAQERAQVVISAVDAAVAKRVEVIESHQEAANLLKSLTVGLANEVKMLNGNPAELAQLILAVGQNDPAAAGELQKIAALPTRATTVKNLTDALGKAIDIERKAHGIKDDDAGDGSNKAIDDLIMKSSALQGLVGIAQNTGG